MAHLSSVSSYSCATAQPFNNLLCSFVYVCKATQRCRVETCQYLQSLACSFGAKASFAIFFGAILVHSAGVH